MRWQGIHADAGLAVFWYRRGQELGNGEAAYWLRQSEVAARAHWNGK
jgi:TPR repeat protein